MNLKLGLFVLVAFVVGCDSSTIVEPPPPCSSTLPSGTLAAACTPPDTTPDPVGNWVGILTTEGSSGTRTFTAAIDLQLDGGDYTGVFTVGDQVFNVEGYSYTGDAGEVQLTFQSPGGELVPQVTPALFTGLTWSGSLTETTFSGTWTQAEEDDVLARGTFALVRQP